MIFFKSLLLCCLFLSWDALLPYHGSVLFSQVLSTSSLQQIERESGLSKETINEIAHHVEAMQKNAYRKERRILCSKESLGYRIRWEKSLHGYLVMADPKDALLIGKGGHKHVYKALLFSPCPRVIVASYADRSGIRESTFMKELKGKKGVIPLLGYSRGRDRHERILFLPYYSEGWLRPYCLDGKYMSPSSIMRIALEVSRGLFAMHKKNLLHRDIRPDNIFLWEKKGLLHAVLADLGCAIRYEHRRFYPPHEVHHRNPIETLNKPRNVIDYYAADVYALGLAFYELVYKEKAEWGELYTIKVLRTCSREAKKQLYFPVKKRFQEAKAFRLASIIKRQKERTPLSSFERFQLLLFEMLDDEAKKRPTAKEIVERISRLL